MPRCWWDPVDVASDRVHGVQRLPVLLLQPVVPRETAAEPSLAQQLKVCDKFVLWCQRRWRHHLIVHLRVQLELADWVVWWEQQRQVAVVFGSDR